MKWETKNKNIGDTYSGKKVTITFKALQELPHINLIKSSCSCTTPIFDSVSNVIRVVFRPGQIPKHLTSQGWFTLTQKITIMYVNGEKDILSFKTKIYKEKK